LKVAELFTVKLSNVPVPLILPVIFVKLPVVAATVVALRVVKFAVVPLAINVLRVEVKIVEILPLGALSVDKLRFCAFKRFVVIDEAVILEE
jgi:hypothetical protein